MARIAVFTFVVLGVAALSFGEPPPPATYDGRPAEDWINQLSHPTPQRRREAAEALAKLGPAADQAVPPLIARLADDDVNVRMYAAYALGKIAQRPAQALPALVKLLEDPDENARYAAEWSLTRIATSLEPPQQPGGPEQRKLAGLLGQAAQALEKAGVVDQHRRRVHKAWLAFGGDRHDGDQAAADTSDEAAADTSELLAELRRAAAAEDLFAQVTAVEQLKRQGAAAVPALVAVLEDLPPYSAVARHVAAVLAQLDAASVGPLSEALQSPHEHVRYAAAQSLLDVGPAAAAALPELTRIIEDADTIPDARHWAIRVIGSLGPAGHGASELLENLLRDPQESDDIRVAAAEALGEIGQNARGSTGELIGRLNDDEEDGDVRAAAAGALAQVAPDSPDALQALIDQLDSDDDWQLAAAVTALGRCGPLAAPAVPALLNMLEDAAADYNYLRHEVIETLGKIGEAAEPAAAALAERLMDREEEAEVQAAAAVALGRIGPPGAHAIAELLDHPDALVRLTAARALVEIGPRAAPAASRLLATLDDDEEVEGVKVLCATALGACGQTAQPAVARLVRIIEDLDQTTDLRAMSLVALARLDRSALPVLLRALDEDEKQMQIAAAYAAASTGRQVAAALPKLAAGLADEEVRPLAVAALSDLGVEALPLMVDIMRDTEQDFETRFASLEVLRELGAPAAAPLLAALNDEELSEAAYWMLLDLEKTPVSQLLAAAGDEVNFTPQARQTIRQLVVDRFSALGAGVADNGWQGGPALIRPYLDRISRATGAGESSATTSPRVAPKLAPRAARPRGAPKFSAHPRPTPVGEPESTDAARAAEAESGGGGAAPPPTEAAAPSPTDTAPPSPGFTPVKVFYGTNRQPLAAGSPLPGANLWLLWAAVLAALATTTYCACCLVRRGTRWPAAIGAVGALLAVTLGLAAAAQIYLAHHADQRKGPAYGADYSDVVEMGVCQVAIPDTHQAGELEAPSLLRLEFHEDPTKHVMLRSVQRLAPDAFFAGLRGELAQKGNNILVFVHGYNVSFEDAARRTAQMAHDLEFAGAPVMYSWPSQANWYQYRVDEKHVELSVDQLRGFLLEVARRSQADTINLVAHSMGSRAVTSALKEIEAEATREQRLFNQVVLAAPDIDAEVFKRRIAPAIVGKAQRITLYASAHDLALMASRQFNSGDPRAGDAGENLVVVPGIETIDVSDGDSSLLGHSYYGDSVSVLHDIAQLLLDQPAQSRPFLSPLDHGGLTYWVFRPPALASRPE